MHPLCDLCMLLMLMKVKDLIVLKLFVLFLQPVFSSIIWIFAHDVAT